MDIPFKPERLGDAGPISQDLPPPSHPPSPPIDSDNDTPPYTRKEVTISKYPKESQDTKK